MIGDFTLLSVKKKKNRPTTLIIKLAMMVCDAQPYSWPSNKPNISPPKVQVRKIIPSQSIFFEIFKSYDSFVPTRIIKNAKIAIGTLIPKIQWYVVQWTIKPPITGPPAAAKALKVPIIAVIRLVFSFPSSSIPMGRTIGVNMAPPIPWKNRKIIKSNKESATIHANEKMPNMTTPISITNFLP